MGAAPVRILVVDDAVVVRRLVTDALETEPGFKVVATAANGRIALDKIADLNPDVVTLDLEMPEMDGIQTLIELRKVRPRLPVIMFSTLTERGAKATMDALLQGANDYVTKPANVGGVTEAIHRIREELVPKIHALSGGVQPSRRSPSHPIRQPSAAVGRARPSTAAIEAVVIGVSTGGPNALSEMIAALPASLSVPILIVQHMPPMFTQLLAERLDARAEVTVEEARSDQQLRPGQVYIAPGDRHLEVCSQGSYPVTRLTDAPPENSCRPSADVLFRTAAAHYRTGLLGVVLTGMGRDGRRGAERIHELGGQVIVQDEATSVVWGMPGAVVEAGVADEILPIDKIAPRIVELTQSRGPARREVGV